MADKLLGLTESGREVEPPKTDLNLGNYGEYYNQQLPVQSTFQKAAEVQAETQFQKNVSDVKATAYKSAAELQSQGQEMQTQLSLGSYMREQSAEKAGWTGGYMLDQVRQGDFLKSTIQSQLYGAQELQKYGLDTQLEAARLAYDLGKDQLAFQYYNEAYQRSLQEAQLYGYYISPENRDMLNQYEAANNVLTTATEGTPEYNKALDIKTKIESFYGPDFSEADLRTFSTATLEMQQIMAGRFDAAMASIEDDPSKFLVKNADGTYATDANGNYLTLDFDDITANDLISYLASDDTGTATSGSAVRSFLRQLGQGTINSYLSSLGEDETGDGEGFLEWLSDNPNAIENWITSLNLTKEQEQKLRSDLGESVNITFSGPKGTVNAEFDLFGGEVRSGQKSNNNNEENETPENPFTPPPANTEDIEDGTIAYDSDKFVKWEDNQWKEMNTTEINEYLNDYVKDFEMFDGTNYSWDSYYDSTNALHTARFGQAPSLRDVYNAFVYDVSYQEALTSGDFSKLSPQQLQWNELQLHISRAIPSGDAAQTKSYFTKIISKALGVEEADIELDTYSAGYPSIKIKGNESSNVGFLNELTPVSAKYENGKYVFYTLTTSPSENIVGRLGISGTGVNNLFYKSGSGLNDKYLKDKTGDYAYILSYILGQVKSRG